MVYVEGSGRGCGKAIEEDAQAVVLQKGKVARQDKGGCKGTAVGAV